MEFNSFAQVKKFIKNFGEMMSIKHGSRLIDSDTEIDINMITNWYSSIKKCKVSFPLNIYYREHGTFTDWDRMYTIENDIKYWGYQSLGKMILTYDPMTKIFNAEFSKTW